MSSNLNYAFDVEGYIVDPDDWDETVAQRLADEEHITLDASYWPILQFMRDYWQTHKVAPDVRHVTAYLADLKGVDKKQAKQELFTLFPYGYVKQACKIAGMQRPRAWSTG